uniref:adhesion G-protein coupled receptor G5-like n=1 Tax=Semicossyphus pulcher TaxID=241346 RepID=UPI0037E9942F
MTSGSAVTIRDGRHGSVECLLYENQCIILCNNTEWFNGSNPCFESEVPIMPNNDSYNFTIPRGTCTAYPCNVIPIRNLMNTLDGDSSEQRQMMELLYIRGSCAQLFVSNQEVKKRFIQIEKHILHNIMNASGLEKGGSRDYNLNELSMNVIKLNFTGSEERIHMRAPQLLPQNESFIPDIWLPVNALRDIPPEKNVIGVVSYIQHSQFQFHQENISSMVIRIELLEERRLQNLRTPITMIFRNVSLKNLDNESWLACSYFDERNDFHWKSDGCKTCNETNGTQVDIICDCDHATPFAVLLVRDSISEIHWEILSYISYIGCGLSAFFTALSFIIYVFSRNHRMDYSISIHVSLSGALFLLNTTFLMTEWGATVKPDWVCVFLAAFMHYSLLCCFTWMAIEALHLYLLLIKVFNTYYKHYLVKLSLAGWGIPGVIVGISLGVKDFKQFYGVTNMTMSDTNQTNSICWITDDSFFYSVNLVYFTMIFIFNTGILVAVASSICKMKQVFRNKSKLRQTGRDPERLSESCKGGLTVLGLTCLMGTTWGLAFLGSGYVSYPILYLFCILNSTQGFFIFLWICLSAKKQRKREMDERLSSSPMKTSATKSD